MTTITTPPQTLPQLTPDGLAIAINNYNHIEQQATLAAAKSALLVAAHAILAAAYVSITKDYHIFDQYPWKFWGVVYGMGGAAIVMAFFLSLWAIIPKSRPDDLSDLLFFASIATRPSAQHYCLEFYQQDHRGFHEMLLRTIYGKSVWLRKNFKYIRTAIWCSLIGTALAIVSLVAMSPHLTGCS